MNLFPQQSLYGEQICYIMRKLMSFLGVQSQFRDDCLCPNNLLIHDCILPLATLPHMSEPCADTSNKVWEIFKLPISTME